MLLNISRSFSRSSRQPGNAKQVRWPDREEENMTFILDLLGMLCEVIQETGTGT
jgi:hypothetical protein